MPCKLCILQCAAASSQELELSQCRIPDKSDTLCLRFPVVVKHTIDSTSPLSHWTGPRALLNDTDSELLAIVEATTLLTSLPAVRAVRYVPGVDVEWGCDFMPCVDARAAATNRG